MTSRIVPPFETKTQIYLKGPSTAQLRHSANPKKSSTTLTAVQTVFLVRLLFVKKLNLIGYQHGILSKPFQLFLFICLFIFLKGFVVPFMYEFCLLFTEIIQSHVYSDETHFFFSQTKNCIAIFRKFDSTNSRTIPLLICSYRTAVTKYGHDTKQVTFYI